jgi:hypothetical protein
VFGADRRESFTEILPASPDYLLRMCLRAQTQNTLRIFAGAKNSTHNITSDVISFGAPIENVTLQKGATLQLF